MTLRTRVASLDDASGELTLSLSKLEMEAARGVANKEEQIDFLHDLHRAVVRKEIQPWRLRARHTALGGAVLVAAALLLPPEMPHHEVAYPALLALGGLALLGAAAELAVYLRALRRERQWLHREEAAVLNGRPLVGGPERDAGAM